MKQFNKISMCLFDSTKGNFKLSVEAVFTKLNNAGGITPLVYVSQNGTANLNPNIYLMFTYKAEEYNKGNFLYTSYPQLFRIRENMKKMSDIISSPDTYIKGDDGVLMVKPEYKEPIVLANIGKQNKWLSFTPVVTNSTEEGVTATIPGVAIEFSSTGGYASVLTVEEFLTVYMIVNDLDLSALQAQMSIAYLATDGFPMYTSQPVNNAGAYQQYPQQNYQPRQYSYQPHQNYSPRQASYQQPAPAQPRPQYQPHQQYRQPAAPQVKQNAQPSLPPREQAKAPIMDFNAIEKTPVSYDDDAAIDAIFNDSAN